MDFGQPKRVDAEAAANPWAIAGDLLSPVETQSRWYCDWPDCDGEPHEGWHFCEHELPHAAGDEFWECRHARANQHPPKGSWRVWLIQAGRGWGKSKTGGEYVAHQAMKIAGSHWLVVAMTREDLKATNFEGDSGLLRALGMHRDDERYNKSEMVLRLPNGATIRGVSAERPEKVRGPNLTGAWLDEFAIYRFPEIWSSLQPAIRRGDARVVITTTPRPTPIIKELVHRRDGTVIVTRGSTFDNAANLSSVALEELRTRFEGTREGRQELYGELLEDDPGALWNRDMLDRTRCAILALPDTTDLTLRRAS